MSDSSDVNSNSQGGSSFDPLNPFANFGTNFQPSQEQIHQAMQLQMKHMLNMLKEGKDPSVALGIFMYTTQSFGSSQIGIAAATQKTMQHLLELAEPLWGDIQKGGNPPERIKGESDADYEAALKKFYEGYTDKDGNVHIGADDQLKSDISKFFEEINKSVFFNQSSNQKLKQEVVDAVKSMVKTIYHTDIEHMNTQSSWQDGLYQFWKKYNPEIFTVGHKSDYHNTPGFPDSPTKEPDWDKGAYGNTNEVIHWYEDMKKYCPILSSFVNNLPSQEKEAFLKQYGEPPQVDDDIGFYVIGKSQTYHQDRVHNFCQKIDGYYNSLQTFDYNWNAVKRDTKDMNTVSTALGQINQALTSGSSALSAIAGAYQKAYTAEQAMAKNMWQAYNKIKDQITQALRARG